MLEKKDIDKLETLADGAIDLIFTVQTPENLPDLIKKYNELKQFWVQISQQFVE